MYVPPIAAIRAGMLRLRFEASFSEERLVMAELTAEPADSFRAEVRALQAPQGYLFAFLFVMSFALISTAFPSFFRALVRRRLKLRMPPDAPM